ncbi:MAG: dihydroneopterin triphosphate diphosphatase [Pseudomonadota bacterium]|jgi:dATP pyrophosphohydrolase
MSALKQPVSVLVVIHTEHLDVLLLERARTPGLWQSVTGSREADESLIQTAQREVFEETGINATQHSLIDWQHAEQFEIFRLWRDRYPAGVKYNTEHVFSLCVPTGTPIRLAPDEHLTWAWHPWRDAAEKVFSWTNRNAILALPGRLDSHTG